jgi:hypothetical protein
MTRKLTTEQSKSLSNFKLLFKEVPEATVQIRYTGCGDEGSGEWNELPDYVDKNDKIFDDVLDILLDLVGDSNPGWCDSGPGSEGNITFRIDTGKVEISHAVYVLCDPYLTEISLVN